MARLTDGTPDARRMLAFDLAALVVFILVGMTSHHDDAAASIFLRNFIPFVGSWLVVAWALGTYRPPTSGRLLATIVLAIPLAVLLRVAWVGERDLGTALTFAGVALLFSTLFLGVGRLISDVIGRRSGAPRAQ